MYIPKQQREISKKWPHDTNRNITELPTNIHVPLPSKIVVGVIKCMGGFIKNVMRLSETSSRLVLGRDDRSCSFAALAIALVLHLRIRTLEVF